MAYSMESFAKTLAALDTKLSTVLDKVTQSSQVCLLREHEIKTLIETVKALNASVQAMAQEHDKDIRELWDAVNKLREEDRRQGVEIAGLSGQAHGATGMAKWLIPVGISLVGGIIGAITSLTIRSK